MEMLSVVDPEKIRSLVEMMSEFDLSEINLKDGEEEIRLTRPGPAPVPVVSGTGPAGPVALPPPVIPAPVAPLPTQIEAPVPAASAAAENLIDIKSPMVGTLYLASDPNGPPFVSVGSKVSPTTVVCIVEAMKVFNEIQAEVSGTIVEMLVGNEDPVEFGQPIFKVRPD